MSFTINISPTAIPELNRVQRTLQSGQLALVGARAVANKVKQHFAQREISKPNKRGWRRQNFWGRAVRAVQTPQAGSDIASRGAIAVVSINKPGVALLYFGGVVRPIVAKMLTIPAIEAAYGKRAGEFNDLVIAKRVNPETGKLQLCLVRRDQTRIRGVRNRRTGAKSFKRDESLGGEVVFWLARSARIRPDATVLPTKEELEQEAGKAMASTLQRIDARQ